MKIKILLTLMLLVVVSTAVFGATITPPKSFDFKDYYNIHNVLNFSTTYGFVNDSEICTADNGICVVGSVTGGWNITGSEWLYNNSGVLDWNGTLGNDTIWSIVSLNNDTMVSYIISVNTSMESYVDAQDVIFNNSLVTYIGTLFTGTRWNITGSNYMYNISDILHWNETKGNLTYVNIVGDNMTGNLSILLALGDAQILLDSETNQDSCLVLQETDALGFNFCYDGSGTNRWVVRNNGGDILLQIERDGGNANFSNNVTANYYFGDGSFLSGLNYTTDTNETIRMNNVVSTNCTGGDFSLGRYLNGTVICGTPAGSGDITAVNTTGPYLIGGAASGDVSLLLNETYLNLTIVAASAAASDTNCNSTGSCAGGDVAYMNYNNTGIFRVTDGTYNVSITGTTITSNTGYAPLIGLGLGNVVTGSYGVGMGLTTVVNATSGVALGSSAHAYGVEGIAIGGGSSAYYRAIALGYQAYAKGDQATAIGEASSATGDGATAIGQQVTAIGDNSIAMGILSRAEENYSVTIGSWTNSSGVYSYAFGDNVTVGGDRSYGFGDDGTSSTDNTFTLHNLDFIVDGNITGDYYCNATNCYSVDEFLIDTSTNLSGADVITMVGNFSGWDQTWINITIIAVNTSMKTYVDAADILVNTSMKAYVDAADILVNTSMKGYVDAADVLVNTSIKTYVDNLNGTWEDNSDNLSGANVIVMVGNFSAADEYYWNTSLDLNISGTVIKNVTRKNTNIAGVALGFYQVGPTGTDLPHLILQSGGGTQASTLLRSFMIANEIAGFHNTTNATDCYAYMNEIGETLKIDCNTTTTGADLLVSDDLQVVGDAFFKDEDGEWHNLNNDLTSIDALLHNTGLDRAGVSFVTVGTSTNLTITNQDSVNLEWNINRVHYSSGTITMTVELINGTDAMPQANYVTVQESGGVAVLKTEGSYPGAEHVDIAKVMVGSDGKIISWTPILIRAYEAIYESYERFEEEGCLYKTGFDVAADEVSLNISTGSMRCVLQNINSANTLNLTNEFFWIRNNGTFEWCTDISCIDEYGDGGSIGVNKNFNIVFGVVGLNKTTVGLVAVVQNEPSTEYISASLAEADKFSTTNYYPSVDNVKNAYTPIARTIGDSASDEFEAFGDGLYYRFLGGIVSSGGGAPQSATTDHSNLENLNWASAGHTFDTDLNVGANNVLANTFNGSWNGSIDYYTVTQTHTIVNAQNNLSSDDVITMVGNFSAWDQTWINTTIIAANTSMMSYVDAADILVNTSMKAYVDSVATDTNESVRVENIVGLNCTTGNHIIGRYYNGTAICVVDPVSTNLSGADVITMVGNFSDGISDLLNKSAGGTISGDLDISSSLFTIGPGVSIFIGGGSTVDFNSSYLESGGKFNFTASKPICNGSNCYDISEFLIDTSTNLSGADVITMVGNFSGWDQTWINTTIIAANTSMMSYVDAADILVNTSMKTYVDAADILVNTSLKTYVDNNYLNKSGDTATADSDFDWNNGTMQNVKNVTFGANGYGFDANETHIYIETVGGGLFVQVK